ncbi:Bacterio-opsin activator HTH domain protein (plasmid) [Haloterrigena turkmenica DSM 5511]|uniref:Bacterio-opsin activator HTH domain protein n=1 Tax=Haloterrigena turkmenica (strain ATCC 51198 / DSM 5511 / JCM 9101 / NCIMB 13204 / VKM B-1734 / 4k) TaxID=543526 RepID=D2S223_HALTV|nr:helix-turn-helix domain-containing protein [Haloterrigena turkmenica]ADB63420.1 Bacterio-opsin activator HTH domain protein [Haloterrigena turkmenica DSM 5511]
MTVTTEFRLRSSALPLVSIPASLPPDEIECSHALCLEPDARVFHVEIDAEYDVSEAQLAALDEVVTVTPLGERADTTIFKLTVELDDSIAPAFDPERFDGAKMKSTTITSDGWYETKEFKDYETFHDFHTTFEDHSISLELISITSNQSSFNDSTGDGLTDRQREALELAVSRGYYESPRKVTAAELAEELGISQPSLSSLLRRGERQILTSSLDVQGYLNTASK